MIICRSRSSTLRALLLLALLAGLIAPAAAQENRPSSAAFGDPPLAALIAISEADENGLVVIRGEAGAVFPGAVVAIRNLYTGQTIYPRAELTGAFLGEIYGPGNTPFWISPASRIESFERNVPGALPGGPGIILYGPLPERYDPPPLPEPPEPILPVTPIIIDGDAAGWPALAEPVAVSVGEGTDALVYALANPDSLYLAIAPADPARPLPEGYATVEVGLEVAGQRFLVRVDPRRGSGGRLYGRAPGDGLSDLGPLGGFSAQGSGPGGAVELRLPRAVFTGGPAPVILTAVRFRSEALALTDDTWAGNLYLPVAEREEADSPGFLPYAAVWDEATPFTLSGPVGGGSGAWHARGRIDRRAYAPGETLYLELQVAMQAPAMPGEGTGLRLGADLWLEPVTVNGAQTAAAPATGNGWSGTLTPSGLPIENTGGAIWLGDATAQKLTIADGTLAFALRWALPLGEDIPPGLYALSLAGYAAVPGLDNAWEESGLLGSGPGVDVAGARPPLIVEIGEAGAEQRLVWSLFQDQPSGSGARGLLPEEDAGRAAVTGRVAYGGGAYVLPRVNAEGEPIAYPLEPYLPALLGNSAYESVPPLIPFVLDSGELAVSVTRPDGTQDDLGRIPIVQNRLGTAERIEAAVFGADSPQNVYRLTTLDPRLTAYTFPLDGLYRITLTGTVRDIWGHTYSGGGTYEVWAAEPLQMLPGVLPGTPFEVGDVFSPALTVVPAFPAEVSLRLTVYPLDGGPPQTREIGGVADRHGHFFPGREAEAWIMDAPGEYVVDITARYTDALGRLWMGTVRGAGVIASPEGRLVARGGRWLAGEPAEDRLAWYMVENRAPEVFLLNPAARMRWPYHSGDVLWVPDGQGRLQAGLRLTDPDGAYAGWLRARLAAWTDGDGNRFDVLANEDELPLLAPDAAGSQTYAYLSAVRPGVTARSFVLGSEAPALARYGWNPDDPYNIQRGVGANGDLPGDYAFLFGGLVVHNDDLDLHETAIYGALAMTIPASDPVGGRVFPPFFGEAGGPNGGPLLTIDGRPVEMFFVPTGFQPGQIFTVGETLTLAGQVAPALPATVEAEVTMPSGRIVHIGGQANAVGYYYDPSQNLALGEPGIWRLRVRVSYAGVTSAGQVYPPYPAGGVLGVEEGEIFVYVLPEDAPVVELTNPRGADVIMPTALPFNLTVAVPEGWEDVRMAYTVLMNGMVLDGGIQPAYGGVFAYNYDPWRLNQRFPNLDTTYQGMANPLSADAVRITLVLLGTDAAGQEALAGRTLTLFGDRLLALYAGWPVAEESTP